MTEQPQPLLSPDGIRRLRQALIGATFTSSGIAARLGAETVAAVSRGDYRRALRVTTDRDPLATLIRLFVCGHTEPADTVATALAPLSLDEALAAGLVAPDRGGLRRGVDLEPYGDEWWVVADVPAAARPGEALPPDHVLGVGGASTTLAGATVRRPVGAALDLGTGCGVQALHLATHADAVTATDVSRRAVRFAATTAALSGQSWELLCGDLAEPVAGRRFDLVVCNPPFVVGPGTATHTYRDSGRAGDWMSAEVAALAPRLLNEGGMLQYLANWVHVAGEDWRDRVAGWFASSGCDVWAIQREVTDPLSYVTMWLADAGPVDPSRRDEWLDWFDANRIEAVGFGIVTARRGGHTDPVVRVEELRQPVEPPLGERIADWFERQDWLRVQDVDTLLDTAYVAADGLQLRQEATLGDEGWAVDRQLLVMSHGLRWAEPVDPFIVSLVAGADGRVPLRHQLALLAAAYDTGEDELAGVAAGVAAHLVERGILRPV